MNAPLSTIDSSKYPTTPENHKNYEYLVNWLCKTSDQREFNTFNELSEKLGVNRNTVHNWITHEQTKAILDEHIRDCVAKDKKELYEASKVMSAKNAHSKRLHHEYYEGWTGGGIGRGAVTMGIK